MTVIVFLFSGIHNKNCVHMKTLITYIVKKDPLPKMWCYFDLVHHIRIERTVSRFWTKCFLFASVTLTSVLNIIFLNNVFSNFLYTIYRHKFISSYKITRDENCSYLMWYQLHTIPDTPVM